MRATMICEALPCDMEDRATEPVEPVYAHSDRQTLRKVVGYFTTGGMSMVRGCGFGYGFVSARWLCSHSKRFVCVCVPANWSLITQTARRRGAQPGLCAVSICTSLVGVDNYCLLVLIRCRIAHLA